MYFQNGQVVLIYAGHFFDNFLMSDFFLLSKNKKLVLKNASKYVSFVESWISWGGMTHRVKKFYDLVVNPVLV